VQNPATQGTRSLQITNVTANVLIQSADFSSSFVPSGATRFLLDLWVPTNQPNPINWGALSAALSIPSAGLFNVTLGTIAVTGKPQNQFSSFEFALPASVQSALASPRTDATIALRLSATPGSGPWYLDNVRFLAPQAKPTLDAILSFEDISKWTSSQLSLAGSTAQKSHLLQSLRLANVPSWFQVTSVPFSSATISSPLGKMRMDIWLPKTQPNPSWFGEVQLFVSVPSAGLKDVSCGRAGLTGLATERFNLLEFTLPANVKAAIAAKREDVSLSLTFNLPASPGPYYLDNVRFA
jgi:hypothetical protein